MANRAYLVGNDHSTTAGPSDGDITYDPDSEILAAASGLIPVLWLSVFKEEDIMHHGYEDCRIPTLLATTDTARQRFQSRASALRAQFPHNVDQLAAFDRLLEGITFRFIKVDAAEIWELDPDSFESRLTDSLRWFSSATDEDFRRLLDLAEAEYDETTRRCLGLRSPMQDVFHGYAWVRDVPWSDVEYDDSEAVEVAPQPLTFGALAKSGIEKHPFVMKLTAIDYFANTGGRVEFPWAIKKGADLTGAYLTYAHSMQWGMVKLAAWGHVTEWIQNNVCQNECQFYREQKDDIDTACYTIVWHSIIPRLPKKLRSYEIAFDTYFTWDLIHMTIEHELVAKGMPSGLCSLLLQAYEAGHFPCGWEGDFPHGKLIVH
jgi:hypothetical protein